MSVYSNSIYELTGLTNNVCFFDGIELTEFDNTIHDTGYTYSGLTLIIDYTNFTSHFDTTGHTYSNVILSNDVYTYTGFTGETHYFVIYDIYSGYTPYIDPLFDGLTENEVIDGFTTDIISCTDILNGLTGTCCPTQQVLSNFPVVMITNEGSGTDNCDDYIARRQELGWTLDFVFNKNGDTGWTESVFWFTGARDEYEVENYADNGLSFRFTDDGKIMWTAYRFSGYCDTISGYTEMFYIDSGTTENALCTGGTINDFNITITFERFNKYDGECDLSNEGGWNDLIIWTGTTEELNKKWTNERNKRLGTLKIYHNGRPIYKYKGFEETVLSDRGYQPFTHVIGGGVTGSDGIHEGTFCYTIKYAGYFEDPATFIEIQNNYDTIITEDYNISECSDDCVDNVVMVTPSRTPTVTRTPSRTPTPTRTPSLTPTVTMTPSITPTPARIPTILGLLYHGCVIKNPLNLSNVDWRIATKDDFDILALNVNNLGGELKETGYTYWQEPNAGATNSTLFTAKGAGRRFIDGSFSYINQRAIFWTATTGLTEDRLYIMELRYDFGLIFTSDVALGFGFSVRLIKDSTTLIPGQIGTYTGNDGKIYRTICIGGDYGNQEWLISNLAETQYRDGTLIPEIRDSASWSDASACGYCAYDNNWLYVPDIAPTPSISATTSITPSITSSISVSPSMTPYWTKLTFDDIANVPVADASDVSAWNTWFDLPTNGTPYTSVSVDGNVVTLEGGSEIKFKDYLFGDDACGEHILEIEDSGCVTELGEGVFSDWGPGLCVGCYNLTKAIFPYVTTVGEWCFADCEALVDIDLSSLTVESFEGATYLFNACLSLIDVSKCVPSGITKIPVWAFSYIGITGFTIKNTVITIDEGAFYGSSLETITIPNNVTTLGLSAFQDCSLLETVTIGEGVTDIGNRAFYDCPLLGAVTIPDSVRIIGSESFWGCTSMATATIGEGVTDIGIMAFYGCISLTSITIPDSVTSIGNTAFGACTALESVIIGSGVTSVVGNTFVGCTSLISATINMTTVLYALFNSNETLKTVVLGNNVKSIELSAFNYCTALESITIPDSVESIGVVAFGNCEALESITIPGSVKSIEMLTFQSCISLKSIILNEGLETITDAAFYGCTALESITIPSSIISFNGDAFSNCTALKSIILSDGITAIGENWFTNIGSLESITIPDSVTSIGNSAFSYCTSLSSITIPDNVTSIGAYAFNHCSALESITIPDSVTSIGDLVFGNCTSLAIVNMYPLIAPTVTATGDSATFGDFAATLHIQAGATGYDVAPWTDTAKFASIVQDL